MLTRAGTVEIELLYFKLYARYYAKRLRGACRAVGKALKWTVIFILFLPMLPSTAFFILADKFTQAFREEGIFMENEECKVSEDAGKVRGRKYVCWAKCRSN
jgi:hypothetical protein